MDNTIRIQDYILDNEAPEEKVEAKKTVTKPEYTVLFQDNCDFVIQRKTKTTEDELVVIISQGQYYIKKKNGTTTALTEKLMLSFIKGLDFNISLPDTYIEGLPCDKNDAKGMYRFLTESNGLWAEAVKQNTIYLSYNVMDEYYNATEDASHGNYYGRNNLAEKQAKYLASMRYKKVFKQVADKRNIDYKDIVKMYSDPYTREEDTMTVFGQVYAYVLTPGNYDGLETRFGAGGIHDFVEMLLEFDEATTSSCRTDLTELLKGIKPVSNRRYRYGYSVWDDEGQEPGVEVPFKAKDFFEYLTYQPYIQGYETYELVQEWEDVLAMELKVFGKITDKYPKNLSSVHRKLSMETRIIAETEENTKIQQRIDARLETLPEKYEKDNYVITPAQSRGEILQVAKQMSNCLAGYVDRYASGSTDIYFMKNESDAAEVAIEIKDGKLRQAFQERNTRPTKKQFDVIKSFCEGNSFVFNTNYTPC